MERSQKKERSSEKITTTLFSDVVVKKLKFTPMKMSKHQHTSCVSYRDGDGCYIMTPTIELTSGGVPPKNDKGYDRNSILVPLDEHPPFAKLLNDIDKCVVKNSETIFGGVDVSAAAGVKRIPLVKVPIKSDANQVEGKECFKLCFKPKLRVDFDSKNILTKVFVKGKPVEVNSINDFAKYVTWGSTIQMVVVIEKVWASNSLFAQLGSEGNLETKSEAEVTFGDITTEVNTQEKAMFGVSLMVLHVNVVKERELSERTKTMNEFSKSNTFGR